MSQGQIVVAAFITPREDLRRLARDIVGPGQIDLIWVDAPLAVCRQRDPKGLYRQSAAGGVPLFTGVNSAFESPAAVDLHLATESRAISDVGHELLDFCVRRLDGPIGR